MKANDKETEEDEGNEEMKKMKIKHNQKRVSKNIVLRQRLNN